MRRYKQKAIKELQTQMDVIRMVRRKMKAAMYEMVRDIVDNILI